MKYIIIDINYFDKTKAINKIKKRWTPTTKNASDSKICYRIKFA